MRQQVYALPRVLTEPLPVVKTAFSRSAVRPAIGRRIHLLPVTSHTDALYEQQTAIALRSVYAQETQELQVPLTSTDERKVASLQESEISLLVGSATHPGIRRKHKPNEDSILVQIGRTQGHAPTRPLPVGLFVVADGMGGHASGQEASQLAIQVLSEALMSTVRNDIGDEEALEQLLADATYYANVAIHERNLQEKKFMGTTLTAALVVDTTAYIVNVGDSRTYLYRQCDGLTQLTRDHSVVARLVEENMIQLDEIYTHPRRNEIYRCLGERASVEVDTFRVPLQAGDSLLLCSDGLWEMVRDPHIQAIIQQMSAPTLPYAPGDEKNIGATLASAWASQASTRLIEAALNAGGLDNISVIVAHVA